MLKTVAMLAAALAVVVTGLAGLPASLVFGRVRRLRLPAADAAAEETPERRSAPLLGGLILWVGTAFGFVTAFLLTDAQFADNGYAGGWRASLTLLGSAFAFGLIGLAVDCVRVRWAERPDERPAALWLVLGAAQLLATALFLAQQLMNGTLSTAVCIPGAGWVELGAWYYPLSALLILCVVNATGAVGEADGVCAGSGFVSALTFLVLAMLMLEVERPGDRYVTAQFAAAVAGSCVGFLLWNFWPAKLRCGAAGGMFLGGALVAMAWSLGRPELLLMICTGSLLNAVGSVLRFCTRGRVCADGAFHRTLLRSGWHCPALTWLACGVGCLGGTLAVLAVFLNG